MLTKAMMMIIKSSDDPMKIKKCACNNKISQKEILEKCQNEIYECHICNSRINIILV